MSPLFLSYLYNDIEVSYGLAYYSTRDCVCGAWFSSSPHMQVDFHFSFVMIVHMLVHIL